MIRTISFFFLFSIYLSCSVGNKENVIETEFFSFVSSEHCKVIIQKQREEIKFRVLFSDTTIKVFCEYGEFIDDLTEYEPRFLISDSLYNLFHDGKIPSEPGVYYVQQSSKIELDRYRKQNVYFDTINGLIRKKTLPRQVGNGITGIYFKDIGLKNRLNPVRFSMYGENLPAKFQKIIENTFNTIKFKR